MNVSIKNALHPADNESVGFTPETEVHDVRNGNSK
jgi:hypothetical protein